MIQTTPIGHSRMLKAVTDTLMRVHLFVNEGELTGYGYAAKVLNSSEWQDGVYPDITWEFNAAEKNVRVMGYYVTDAEARVMYSENFPASAENEDDAPGFVIGKQGDRISVGMRLNLFVAQANG